ncbi:carbohydrate ABC transporter permease [Streptomyces sp. WMMB 322]|uniref:carbohydrate ABC transporter permease n=1 Tax=Streptomyces sp. WMMB 322 TaxID=1286821 RepID=UPI0006E128AB|nr:sugar ABC transporter permease [Streptomyces sp. WMMB 322]SCK36203.1 carbohydrate ABC transporter membrane protein 1, CUT1 family (TC 3.A.1.1.-) [Streptomyces sp. WMMB 322]
MPTPSDSTASAGRADAGAGPAVPSGTSGASRPATGARDFRPRRSSRPDSAAWFFLGPFLALFVFAFVLPIVYAVYQSLLKVERHGPLGLGEPTVGFGGLENYAIALQQADFIESFGRVLLFGVVQVPVMLVLALVLALLLDQLSHRWAGLLRASYFLPYGIPGVIATILWGFLYVPGISPITEALGASSPDFLGYDNVLWSVANIVVWEFAGYNMLIIVAQLKSIPQELYEAARIDGAGPWQTALRIKIPMVRPALVLTCVFSIIGTMQLFAEPLVIQVLSPAVSSSFTPNLSAYNDAFANANVYLAAAKAVLLALVACALSFGFLTLVTRKDRSRR